jgi:D-arabinose 1-dehydrogenase-like Zn-dependent alcohol dehydrogenase
LLYIPNMKYTEWKALSNDERKSIGWHRHPRIKTATLFGITLIIVFIVVVFGISKNTSVHLNRKPTAREAFNAATIFVKERLQQPAAASFPTSAFTSVIDTAVSSYQVNSSVKSLDKSGKTINANWEIKMQYQGGDWSERKSWKVVEVSIK